MAIHGAFIFVKSAVSTEFAVPAMAAIQPYYRSIGFAPVTAKQVTQRQYMMVTQNAMAADPFFVGTPGVRPMTACCEPWLHSSGTSSTEFDPQPAYRERLASLDVTFGEDGVAKAVAATVSTTPTLDAMRYRNNVGQTGPRVQPSVFTG